MLCKLCKMETDKNQGPCTKNNIFTTSAYDNLGGDYSNFQNFFTLSVQFRQKKKKLKLTIMFNNVTASWHIANIHEEPTVS